MIRDTPRVFVAMSSSDSHYCDFPPRIWIVSSGSYYSGRCCFSLLLLGCFCRRRSSSSSADIAFSFGCRVGDGDVIAVAACCCDGVRRPSNHPARIHYFGTWIGNTTTTTTNGQRTTLRGQQRLMMTMRSSSSGRGFGGTIARGLGGSARHPPGGRSVVG